MFPLHDHTRRLLCRVLFVIAGVLPTTAVLAWSISLNLSAHRDAVCAQLEQTLGVTVNVESVSHPRPGLTLLEEVKLCDPETGILLLSSRLVEIVADDQTMAIVASQPEVIALEAAKLWRIVERYLHSKPSGNTPKIRLATAELTLRETSSAYTLVDCVAQFESNDTDNAAVASFRLAGAATGEAARLRVLRSARSGQPATAVELHTGDTPLPCDLLALPFGQYNSLGPNATFRGTGWLAESPAGWQGELTGKFSGIDLHSVVSNRFPHQLGGTAELTVRRGVVRSGRLEEADGSLRAGPGVVSHSLLAAAAKQLGVQLTGEITPGTAVEYDELAIGFAISTNGLNLRGQCDASQTGVLMKSSDAPLLLESKTGVVPVVSLATTLVPDGRVQVPATRQTDWLLHVLPLPSLEPSGTQAMPLGRLKRF